ncbi:hypothetical protein GGH96_002338 [Coemansia sp. RSA 1972]|nr:hypothetical protein GGH96_002338 [Coemansia sp. RSA 1972]
MNRNAGAQAEQLYSEAVYETPPNRNKLDRLVDLLCGHPRLIYDTFFAKAHKAAELAVDIWHGAGDIKVNDRILILTVPALWGWTVMEETLCHAPPPELLETRYPQLAQQFLKLAERTLAHPDTTPGPVVRRTIQALTRFWPEIIKACVSLKTQGPVWRQLYEATLRRADSLIQLSEQSNDPALQMHLAKFLETEASIFTAAPQPGGSPRSRFNLDRVPSQHAYISKTALAARGERARQLLLRLLPSSDHVRLCNTLFITATINSIVYLMNLRPQFCKQLLERLVNWYDEINSSEQTMSHLQSMAIGKTLRIALLQLYTRKHMGAYSEILEHKLDTLGGPEWARWQEFQKHERERRQRHEAWERSLVPPKKAPDEGPHSARWVPAPEDGQEEPVYQPAPGTDVDADVDVDTDTDIPPLKPLSDVLSVNSSSSNSDDNQIELLEERTKRVKLDIEQGEIVVSDKEPGVPEKELEVPDKELQQAAVENDSQIETEMQDALRSEPPFEMLAMDAMSPDTRQKHLVEAIRRVIRGSGRMRKFIDHKRVLQSIDAASKPAARSQALEGNMVQQVQLVANCYLVFFEACRARHLPGNMGASTDWSSMHDCVEDILQYVVDAPQASYELAMALLYELWMSVVTSDPELKCTPDKPESEFSVLALYLRWCERIFDAIVKHSVRLATRQAKTASAAQTTDGAAAVLEPTEEKSQGEPSELILAFIRDAPYILPALLAKVAECLKSPSTAPLGLTVLETAIEIRPPIFTAGLDILLEHAASLDRATRSGCIQVILKHGSSRSSLLSRISLAAKSHFVRGVRLAEKQSIKLDEQVASIFNRVDKVLPVGELAVTEAVEARKHEALALRKQKKQAIEAGLAVYAELFLKLCAKRMELLAVMFVAYKGLSTTVQVIIRRIITPLIKSMADTPAVIIPVLKQFPIGTETLAQRIVFLLCVDTSRVPARELVQAVLNMCDARHLDGNFLAYLGNGMNRAEVHKRLPTIVAMLNGSEGPQVLVSEFFTRVTTSYLNQPSVLTPAQLLVALHEPAVATAEQKAEEAVRIFGAMTNADGTLMFPPRVFDEALAQLVGRASVPILILKTAFIYREQHHAVADAAVKNLLQTLIEHKVWEMRSSLLHAFILLFRAMLPDALPLVKSIPPNILQMMVKIDARFGAPVIYSKMIGIMKAAVAVWAMGSAATVLAHSWVDCAKYDPVNQVCLGYTRGYPGRANPDINTLYSYLFSGSPATQAMCSPKQQAAMNYSPLFPIATVQPGETVYTSWEQNGHLNNANPTKIDILYYPDANKQFADVTERNTAMVAGTMDFATNSTCYKPGDSNSVCFGSWTVPKDLVPGNTYHFVWFWYFNQNPAGEWYSTCFDFKVEEASYVVETKPMNVLLAMTPPSNVYAQGMTDAVQKQMAQVTTLGKENQDAVTSYSSQAPVASETAVVSQSPTPEPPASSAPVEPAQPSSSTVAPPPAPQKCRPRPVLV